MTVTQHLLLASTTPKKEIKQSLKTCKLFPGGSDGKECLQCRRPGFHPWVGKTPWRRERLPTPVFWPGEFHGLYGPWGRKESDITLTLTFSDRYNEIEVTV